MQKLRYIVIILIIVISSSIVYGENLNLSGESYILMDCKTGRVLYEKNAHEQKPMASTTKIMTALVALENGNLEEQVTIDKNWVGVEGSSIYLKEGEVISLKDLLYGLLLRSGNDSAVAIASHVGETIEEFIELMNKKAQELGALNTNFMNPHGLHHDLHYSTAYDLALITRAAFSYEDFSNIVKSKSYISNRETDNYFYNKNKTLWEYIGGDGVKTGYTTKSGRCLVSSATRNGMHLIAVSLKAGDWFNDNYKLLEYGFNNYKTYLIYDKGQFIKNVKIVNGDKEYVSLISGDSLIYPLSPEERSKINIGFEIFNSFEVPIEKGQILGHMSTYLDGKLIEKTNLVAKSSIKKANLIERILRRVKNK